MIFDALFTNKSIAASRRAMKTAAQALRRIRSDIPLIAIEAARAWIYSTLDNLQEAVQIADCMPTIEEMQEIAEGCK